MSSLSICWKSTTDLKRGFNWPSPFSHFQDQKVQRLAANQSCWFMDSSIKKPSDWLQIVFLFSTENRTSVLIWIDRTQVNSLPPLLVGGSNIGFWAATSCCHRSNQIHSNSNHHSIYFSVVMVLFLVVIIFFGWYGLWMVPLNLHKCKGSNLACVFMLEKAVIEPEFWILKKLKLQRKRKRSPPGQGSTLLWNGKHAPFLKQ